LLPYNDSEAARYLIEKVKHYATQQPTQSLRECLLMWVVDDSIRRGMPLAHRVQEAQEKIQPVKAELEAVGLRVYTEVREGNPLLEVLAAAQTYDISAIAIGADYRSGILEWTVPSFANEVLRRSWFPVLFFSPKK
jgi:nucleotide-binding universal stress UspA family protein